MSEEEAADKITEVEEQTGLPATDVIRYGPDKLAKALLGGPYPEQKNSSGQFG
jgi:uncharacterized NAD-dependent epimerase/dehydratase family protein